MIYPLRPYQNRIESDIRDAYRQGYRAPLLVSPCGSGKTVTYASITESAGKRGKRILILEFRKELIDQTSEKLFAFGVDHGIIAPGRCMTHDHVQIASVQTLVRRLDKMVAPDMIIVDEAHHAVAGSWNKILSAFPRARLLGVTATPIRLDGKGLGINEGGFFDKIVMGPTVKELQNQGFLSRTRVYSPPVGINLAEIHKKYGEYNETELEEEMDKPRVIGNAVEHYLKICPGIPAIAFSPSVKMAKNVAQEFRNAGISSESLDGTDDMRTRKYRISALGDGGIMVLSTAEIVAEGTDIPIVGAAILLRPTLSFGLHRQQIGRCMRPYPGKEYAIILDHVGNVGSMVDGVFKVKHGFPEDDVEWSLDGVKKKEKESGGESYHQCLRCYFCFPAWLKQCPQCGEPKESGGGSGERELQYVDGTLQAVSPEDVRVEYLKREELKRNRKELIKNAKTLDELYEVADMLGYKRAWAYYIHKSRLGRRSA